MTLREATIEALVELGTTRKDAEQKARASDGLLPGTSGMSQSPVRPGTERAFIDALKQILGKVNANGSAVPGPARTKVAKRAKRN
jgi:hypothetical protein